MPLHTERNECLDRWLYTQTTAQINTGCDGIITEATCDCLFLYCHPNGSRQL
ncbi:unnamed protein product [Nezara viridula]|uniref:Uncharacterized protein n=1 Tax=Nezara viridula TaxID=85310 RepID=A0A9P0MXS7_NEZVI|nr:unnamed protein product [Nezara viridula]